MENLNKIERAFENQLENKVAQVIASQTGYVIEVNQCFENTYGYTRHFLIGKHISEFMPEKYRESHNKRFNEVRCDMTRATLLDSFILVHILNREGEEIPVKVGLSMFCIKNAIYFVATFRKLEDEV